MANFPPQSVIRNEAGEKWCKGCKHWLPVDLFHVNNEAPDGLFHRCNSCAAEEHKKYRLAHGNYCAYCWNARKNGWDPLPRPQYDKMILEPCTWGGGSRKDGLHIGIDRKDSTKSYPHNSQPCCPRHQSMKKTMDNEAFALHLKKHPEDRACGNMSDFSKRPQLKLPMLSPRPVEPKRPLPLFDTFPERVG